MMKIKSFFLISILLVVVSTTAFANNVDIGYLLNGGYSLALSLSPDNKDGITVVLNHSERNGSLKIDSRGDMTEVGDFEVWEGKKYSGALGLGYRVGPITPWVTLATQSTNTTKHEMKIKDGKLTETKADITDPLVGIALGINAEYWIDESWGIFGTVAKMPKGVLFDARLKYKVIDVGTAHIGYSYNDTTGHGFVMGLGIAY